MRGLSVAQLDLVGSSGPSGFLDLPTNRRAGQHTKVDVVGGPGR